LDPLDFWIDVFPILGTDSQAQMRELLDRDGLFDVANLTGQYVALRPVKTEDLRMLQAVLFTSCRLWYLEVC
jgi:hypothetical protein